MNNPRMLPVGAELGSRRYRVTAVLGQGGFGITYKADDIELRREVAIKEFCPSGSTRDGLSVVPPALHDDQYRHLRDRVRDEARALARFRNPHIVTVHEVFDENETVYVVMELLTGESLGEVLETNGALPDDVMLRLAADVGAALDEVHRQQLLHRDVKPDNIMIVEDGSAVLVDFGTARDFNPDESSMMSMILTPGYAPLEQYSSRDRFGPATDVYALGATLFHASTGQRPAASLDRLRGEQLTRPASIRPQLAAHVSDAICWAMELESADRPQTAEEFVAAIHGDALASPATVVPEKPVDADKTVTTPSAAAPPAAAHGREPMSRSRRRLRRRSRKAVRFVVNLALAIVVGLVITLLATWWAGRADDPSTDPATSSAVVVEMTL